MDNFLKTIADRILAEHPTDTDKVLVIFNNRRSSLFFKRQFSGAGRPVFLPQTMVIDDFVARLGGLEIIVNEFLLFELYQIHIELGGEKRKYQTFEEFIPFGELMIGDFSEIDRYMVPAKDIFDNLHSLKAIGEWDIEKKHLSERQEEYLKFYRSLYDYYDKLRTRLFAEHKAYGGMAYRHVAEHIEDLAKDCPYTAIYFIGFNALSACERAIIREYTLRGIGHLLTDADTYYLRPEQEAGHFLRLHMKEFPELVPQPPSHFEQPKDITIVECPENILQCKYAGQLLSQRPELINDKELESTAIVLADESLLVPTLNALPDASFDYSVNISMGYAYTDSVTHALILKLLSLYRRHNDRGYYHLDLVEVLADRHIGRLLGIDDLRHKTERFLEHDNRIRCSGDETVRFVGNDTLAFLFPDHSVEPSECLAILRELTTLMVRGELLERNKKEKQAVASLTEVLNFMATLMERYNHITNIDTFEKIYTRIAQRHTIDLIGEPLSGLQILGMLETRNLDFKRVILLSANEGVLPAGRGGNTLIPHELKVHFHLPTYQEKDSVYAYHFYRLLQRADEIYLLYNSETEAQGKGEASRFIRQIEGEMAEHYPVSIKHVVVSTDGKLLQGRPSDRREKTPAVMQRLNAMADQGLSPTSFASYLDCPMKYYYTRVMRIEENRGLDESLDASQLGDCVHNVLQTIFQADAFNPRPIARLQETLGDLHRLMQEQFDTLYHHGRSSEGRNQFTFAVAETQVRHILEKELAMLKQGHTIQIVATEQDITPYTLATTPEGQPVRIKGKVDRIDYLDGVLRIIDYKTGKVEDRDIHYSDKKQMPGKWLQLMWYALIYCRAEGLSVPVRSGIYPLRNTLSDVKLAQWNGESDITPAMLAEFEERLRASVTELMTPTQPFLPTPGSPNCDYCPARAFCPHAVK